MEHRVVFGFSYQSAGHFVEFLKTHSHDLRQVAGVRYSDFLRFDRLVNTTSAPVSIDFGHDHMYVAGETTVDSFVLHGHSVGWMDGTASLELAGGGPPPNGSTAQVGVIDGRRLLVTLKTDPDQTSAVVAVFESS